MSDLEVFEIDDEFDPLAEDSLEDLEEENPNDEYNVPKIPDAERSVVPAPVELPPAQRIEKLISGIPGQQFRILACIQACMDEPVELAQIIEAVDEKWQTTGSVYSTGRLVQLLEQAGAIDRIEPEEEEPDEGEGGEAVDEAAKAQAVAGAAGAPEAQAVAGAAGAPEAQEAQAAEAAEAEEAEAPTEEAPAEGEQETADEEQQLPHRPLDYLEVDPGQEYLEVELARPCTFLATQAGVDAVQARTGMEHMQQLLDEEPQYLPVYKRILTMCNTAGGRLVQEINAVIDPDPLCAEPRRFSTYFLRKLEVVGAVKFQDAWCTTDYGKRALDLGLLVEAEEAGNLEAAAPAKEKQLAKEAKFEAEKAERERFAAELAAKQAEEAARAAEAGEPLPQPKPKHGSGGPLFAFPYVPAEEPDESEETEQNEAEENANVKPDEALGYSTEAQESKSANETTPKPAPEDAAASHQSPAAQQ